MLHFALVSLLHSGTNFQLLFELFLCGDFVADSISSGRGEEKKEKGGANSHLHQPPSGQMEFVILTRQIIYSKLIFKLKIQRNLWFSSCRTDLH